MKFFLILCTAALLITGGVSEGTWQTNCISKYFNISNGKYIFTVKKGEIGDCRSDKVKQDWGYENK